MRYMLSYMKNYFGKKVNIMKIVIMYNKNEKFEKEFVFEIDEKEAEVFEKNVEKALICRIGNCFNMNTSFYYGNKNYIEK